MRQRVLISDDNSVFAQAIEFALKREKIETKLAADPAETLRVYTQGQMDFDIVVLDFHYHGSDISGADLALRIRQLNPSQVIVFMTGLQDLESVDTMFKTGVGRTFIRKGGDLKEIVEPIVGLLKSLRPANTPVESTEDELIRISKINAIGMVGRSKALQTLAEQVDRLRRFQSRFLIIGASGTGKELIARAFAKNKTFYAVDCGSFDKSGEQFIESQLFGRKKGAYTGADSDMIGAFEAARGGVIFLDELHCLSLGAQSKLLRTLQEGKFRGLGDPSGKEIMLDAVVVAATQPLIFNMIKDGTFKEDLFARIARQKLHIPALVDRIDDVRPLAEHFFKIYSKKHGLDRSAHPQLLRDLESYSWPQNVRQLEGSVDSMIMNSLAEVVTPECFAKWLAGETQLTTIPVEQSINLNQLKDSLETDVIIAALAVSSTVGHAAASLNVARTTLNDRMRRLFIQPRQHLKVTKS